jgi:hypothetical protein
MVVFEQFCLRLKLAIVTIEAIFGFAWADLCDMQFAQISPHVRSDIKSMVDGTAESQFRKINVALLIWLSSIVTRRVYIHEND